MYSCCLSAVKGVLQWSGKLVVLKVDQFQNYVLKLNHV